MIWKCYEPTNADRDDCDRESSGEWRIVGVLCFQPFSNGLVTVMVPQLRRENSLLLWSTLDLNSPVHAFVGHDDVVLEFQWRPQKEGDQSDSGRVDSLVSL